MTTVSEVCVTVNERKEAVDLSQYVLQVFFVLQALLHADI